MLMSLNTLVIIITNNERDDKDVLREVRAMFTRTNILARRFSLCSVSVKIILHFLDRFASAFMEWNCGVVILHVLLIGYDHVILSA